MTTIPRLETLTLPEALMAFVHNGDGQVYQSVRPKQLAAAAELGELVLEGLVHVADGRVTAVSGGGAPTREWMERAVADLGSDPVKVDAWIRRRADALKTQQGEAENRGVLHRDRAKLAGLVGYDRHLVDDAVREGLLADLDAADAMRDPRAAALAKLLITPAVLRVVHVDDARRDHWSELARTSDAPGIGPVLSALDYGVATAVGIGILGS